MNNLQRIKAAWKIGWAATLEENGVKFQLLSKTNNFIVLREQESYSVFEWANFRVENMNIIGYLYAGQLAGNEPIPEGQRFKLSGEKGVWRYDAYSYGCSDCNGYGEHLRKFKNVWTCTTRELMEPVFD